MQNSTKTRPNPPVSCWRSARRRAAPIQRTNGGFVDLNRSQRRRAMSAICAQQTAGVDVKRPYDRGCRRRCWGKATIPPGDPAVPRMLLRCLLCPSRRKARIAVDVDREDRSAPAGAAVIIRGLRPCAGLRERAQSGPDTSGHRSSPEAQGLANVSRGGLFGQAETACCSGANVEATGGTYRAEA